MRRHVRTEPRRRPPFGLAETDVSVPYWDVGLGEGSKEAEADADAATEGDGSTEVEAGTEGSGTGVGSGMKRDGMPRTERSRMSTKKPMTMKIHGRASRSLRVGSAPR